MASDLEKGYGLFARLKKKTCRRRATENENEENRRVSVSQHNLPTNHHKIEDIRVTYMLKICRAFMFYGAPTHKLERYMRKTAQVLDMNVQSFYLPGCMILSFNDASGRSIDMEIVRCNPELNFTKLHEAHTVYKDVIRSRIGVEEATRRITAIEEQANRFPTLLRVLAYGITSMAFGPISFGAQPIDIPIIFVLGCIVGVLDLVISSRTPPNGYVFEVISSILCSFVGRAVGSIILPNDARFCFSAISQASIVVILPGFAITSSALELGTQNVVTGSVSVVKAVIYTFFLAIGFTIGTTIYGAMDGNATSSQTCHTTWPLWWKVIFLPVYMVNYNIVIQGRWRMVPIMFFITIAGWFVNYFSGLRLQATPQIAVALGALTIGLVANFHSRMGRGPAAAILHPAMYTLVPGSFAASGSFISGLTSADDAVHSSQGSSGQNLESPSSQALFGASYNMAQIAIGLTVGLSFSGLLISTGRYVKRKVGKLIF